MRQLVELKSNANKFAEKNVEVIAVFREESKGTDGLAAIKKKTGVDFTLCLDTPVEQTKAYSTGNKEFTNYVIDQSGVIRGIIPGDLRNRAKSKELLDIVASLGSSADSGSDDNKSADSEAVERACLDYVEGIYDVKPELIKRSVHPELKKFGFWRAPSEEDFKAGSAMTFDQLVDLAGKYNKDGKTIPSSAPKKVVVYEVMDKIATAKLTAAWGTDFFHLVKEDGQWKILQIVWQSPAKKK